jgi:uncharacterized protein YjbI with pentapeptide repeats
MKKITQKELESLIKTKIEKLKEAELGTFNWTKEDQAAANFMMLKLLHATLSNARMHGADLSRARLIGANLSGADLSNADLMGANLCMANLSGADLHGSRLIFSYLMGTDLSGANLSDADLKEAKYDQNTKWPDGFDPITAGAILKSEAKI